MQCTKYSIVQNKGNQILFLNLFAFSLTGGVEKVSRNFVAALSKLFPANTWISYSMHDQAKDFDQRYGNAANYKAFGGSKFSFILASIQKGLKYNTIILSHINLLLVAKLISLLKPKHRFILFAHGIEVWGNLPSWKLNFLKAKAEIWAVSNYTKQKLITIHGIAEERIKVLNNSLAPFVSFPLSFEKPGELVKRHKIDLNSPVLYTLSRLSSSEQYKGYDTVIAALANLKQQGQSFTYLLAGRADEIEKQRIAELIERYDLTDNVKVIGYVSEEELSSYFLLADVFIMPSKGEGFGIVFIEAAAHGCQVIAGNVDGSTDALLKGELGQLVDPNKEQEILAAIQSAINNKQHQPKVQQELAVEHFGFDQYIEKVGKLMDNC